MFLSDSEILDFIDRKFHKNELNELCFRIGIDYEDEALENPRKRDSIIAIIKHCKRKSKLYELASMLENQSGIISPIPMSNVNTDIDVTNDKFDVFLCHNSLDKSAVKHIAEQLKDQGIKVWLDEEVLRAGNKWLEVLDEQVKNTKSAAVFFGRNGFGRWQNVELQMFAQESVNRDCALIPVILADAPVDLDIPSILGIRQWVDFRKSSPAPMQQLISGITDN